MLSQKSERFLVELRMYLISKSKNDAEMNEVLSELEDHLIQAEANGKSVENIVGSSPKAYMKSIGQSMSTDYREIAILTPLMLLLLTAYFSWSHALSGNFSVSVPILWMVVIGGILGVLIYGVFLFKGMPKLLHSKWLYVVGFLVYTLVVGGSVLALFWINKVDAEPIFTATPLQNNLIALVCLLIFIGSAIYTKTWFTIIIPVVLAIGPLTGRFLPESINENPTYMWIAAIFSIIITIVVLYFILKKPKKADK